jgi:hypothetical protein
MDFNLISKNNIGIIGTLLLAIFLSQHRTMDFMFRTALGRLSLIVLILAMSYTNKILGVVGVLFVVIIFCSSGVNFMEGAENMADSLPSSDSPTTAIPTVPSSDPNTDVPPSTTDVPPPAMTPEEPATTDPTSSAVKTTKKATTSTSGTPIDQALKGVTETEDTTTENAGLGISSTENAAVESFDILGLERNIQKGKNSNSIPIHNNNDYGNILPTDFGMGFNIGFSIF